MASDEGTAFQIALGTFKESLAEKERTMFQVQTYDDLKKDIEALQEKQGSDRKLLDLNRLSSFLEAMRQYEEIIELFLNTSEFVAFIWGPIKFLLRTASAYSEALSALLDAYQQIGEVLPLLKQYEELFGSRKHLRAALLLIYKDILDFHRKALAHFNGSTWRKLFKAVWKTFNADFSRILSNLRQHRRLIETQASILQIEEFRAIQEAAKRQWEIDHDREIFRRRIAVQDWLSAANADVDLNEASEARHSDPKSGHWLLSTDIFTIWAKGDVGLMPMLWMTGQPGCGKTVLASLVIDELRKLTSSTIIYFFCKYRDPERDNFIAVTKALLLQLVITNEGLINYVYEKQSTSGQAVLRSPDLVKELLDTAIRTSKSLSIVLDGLDECYKDEAKAIIQWIQPLIDEESNRLRPIRCLFISQEDKVARKSLVSLPTLKIKPENNARDIQRFVKAQCDMIRERFELSDDYTMNVVKDIIARTDGMFLFAKLLTKHLQNQQTLEKMESELDPSVLPQNIGELYGRIVEQIREESANGEIIDRLLKWLVCAKRRMKWHEIQGGFSINLEAQSVDFPGRKLRSKPKDLCGSIVEFGADGIVKLVHRTAEQYLIERQIVEKEKGELDLAILCLSYLTLPCMSPDLSEEDLRQYVQLGQYAFLDYAAANWHKHLEAAIGPTKSKRSLDDLSEVAQIFIETYLHPSWKAPTKPRKASKALQALASKEYFVQLVDAVHATKSQLQSLGKLASMNDVLSVPEMISAVRKGLEAVEANGETIEEYYGSNLFKCPRMNCKSFHQGHTDGQSRDNHMNAHDRPFLCTFDDCPQKAVGFATLRSLEAHLLKDHNVDHSSDDHFPSLSSNKHHLESIEEETFEMAKRPRIDERSFKCDIYGCQRAFTRKFNKLAHMRSHQNEKPEVCDVCGKKFARKSDCSRHKKQHSDEHKVQCKGKITGEDGQIVLWGCGKIFTRQDGLKAHFRSEAGSACARILLEHKARQKQLQDGTNSPLNVPTVTSSDHEGQTRQIPFDLTWRTAWEQDDTMISDRNVNTNQDLNVEFGLPSLWSTEADQLTVPNSLNHASALPGIDELFHDWDFSIYSDYQ